MHARRLMSRLADYRVRAITPTADNPAALRAGGDTTHIASPIECLEFAGQ